MQAQASPGTGAPPSGDPARTSRTDNFPNTLGDAQQKLTQDAVKQLVTGEASTTTIKGNRVIKVDSKNRKGQTRYVDYPVEREEDIFTVLVDFGTDTKTASGGTPGPVHNNIPAPDRNWDGNATDDNSTYWVDDFNRAHYEDLMFGEGESFRDFYLKQSNGRFLAKGDVSNWVTVPYNEARYGRSDGYPPGVMAFEMLTGQTPYLAETMTGFMKAHLLNDIPDARDRVPELPVAAPHALARALANSPHQPHESAAARIRGRTGESTPGLGLAAGHTTPNFTLPLGSFARIEADSSLLVIDFPQV